MTLYELREGTSWSLIRALEYAEELVACDRARWVVKRGQLAVVLTTAPGVHAEGAGGLSA